MLAIVDRLGAAGGLDDANASVADQRVVAWQQRVAAASQAELHNELTALAGRRAAAELQLTAAQQDIATARRTLDAALAEQAQHAAARVEATSEQAAITQKTTAQDESTEQHVGDLHGSASGGATDTAEAAR